MHKLNGSMRCSMLNQSAFFFLGTQNKHLPPPLQWQDRLRDWVLVSRIPAKVVFVVVQLLSPVWLFVTTCTATSEVFLSLPISQSLPKLMFTESVIPFNHLILCHPLLLLPRIFPRIRVFSNDSALCIWWPKYLEFQLQHQSFQGIFTVDFL